MLKDRREIAPIIDVTTKNLIEIKHRDTGAVIFKRDVEANSMLKTLRIALILKIDVRYADMSGEDLSYGYFVGANLTHCNFTRANLTGANFNHARLDYATLFYANAYMANFEKAVMHQVYAQHASFKCASLKNAMSQEGDWRNADWTNADATGFITRGSQLKNIILDGCILDKTNTRINYLAPKAKIPCVCDQVPCAQCVDCESPKKIRGIV